MECSKPYLRATIKNKSSLNKGTKEHLDLIRRWSEILWSIINGTKTKPNFSSSYLRDATETASILFSSNGRNNLPWSPSSNNCPKVILVSPSLLICIAAPVTRNSCFQCLGRIADRLKSSIIGRQACKQGKNILKSQKNHIWILRSNIVHDKKFLGRC